jgi:hypothetical protein
VQQKSDSELNSHKINIEFWHADEDLDLSESNQRLGDGSARQAQLVVSAHDYQLRHGGLDK